jgi:5-methylcytosine-specific restriction endonuclease McrA
MTDDHNGPGVIPGRYHGEAIPIHEGPTSEKLAFQQHKTDADRLAGRICAAAAETARSTSLLLELVGEFDAIGGMKHWTGFKSLAHWLSWSCAMTPGVAREHVRVARALRRMPTIAGLLREGRLSYSKVREVTRVVDVVDEARLAGLALTATAAQLAKMISGFRSADGMRIPQQTKRSVTWHEREDGMIDVRTRLPKEEAAVLIAAMDVARDQFGPPPPKPDPAGDCREPAPGVGAYSKADALLDVARVFLNTAPQDRSGEDRTLVVVHVSADNLGGVPAGTSQPAEAVCQIENVGSIETATAQRLACDNPVLGAVVDKHGRMLALGRTRRLVSTAQRRALMIRDHGMCQYPGCHQTRHLKAHHLIPWILGGRTDLENLILLCQWHHTAVHEGGISISNEPDGWLFTKPDGQRCDSWVSDENLARHLDFARRRAQQQTAEQDQLAEVDSFHHPDARIIRPRWTGEPFDLHACVRALFTIKLPKSGEDQDQQAA